MRRLEILVVCIVLLTPWCVACGGQTTTVGPDNGDADYSDSSDAQPEAELDGGDDPLCQARAAYYTRCGLTSDCYQRLVAYCLVAEAPVYSRQVDRALAMCFAAVTDCSPSGPNADLACLESAFSQLIADDAQMALAQAYCNACDPSPMCTDRFLSNNGDLVLPYSDPITERIRATCIAPDGGAPICDNAFFECLAQVIVGGGGTDASTPSRPDCTDGG